MVGTTACEDACPPGAIQFGDMNDPESDPRQYLDNVPLARAIENDPDDDELQEAIEILQGETEADEADLDEALELIEGEYGDEGSRFKLLRSTTPTRTSRISATSPAKTPNRFRARRLRGRRDGRRSKRGLTGEDRRRHRRSVVVVSGRTRDNADHS